MTDWLAPLRGALDSADGPVRFFFRDDDAGWADDELCALLDLFEAHEMPIDVAAIPAAVTPRLARDLLARLEGSRLRIHQHGYADENHEPTGRKCEFGPSRSAGEQHRDIAGGRARLLETFGTQLDPVFTPPWNRCTDDTAEAMLTEGLTALSRDTTAVDLATEIVEVPITVDWAGRRKGVRLSHHQVAERIAEAVRRELPVGVMLHHAQIDAEEWLLLAELLTLAASHPSAETTHIVALAGV